MCPRVYKDNIERRLCDYFFGATDEALDFNINLTDDDIQALSIIYDMIPILWDSEVEDEEKSQDEQVDENVNVEEEEEAYVPGVCADLEAIDEEALLAMVKWMEECVVEEFHPIKEEGEEPHGQKRKRDGDDGDAV